MRSRQAAFEFTTWGGARKGAGRRASSARSNVSHTTRGEIVARHPLHVTLRVMPGLESLRRRRAFRVVRAALSAACERFGTRCVHFSVLGNHVHLICEAPDAQSLSRAMKGVGVRIARGLNRLWGRSGAVIADRYHARALATPREVRNALNYVLQNARGHGIPLRGPDPCSTGPWFDGWADPVPSARTREPCPSSAARTWLLRVGWRRHGLIALVS